MKHIQQLCRCRSKTNLKEGIDDGIENPNHCCIIERINCDDVQMAHHPNRHRISSTSWRSHRKDELRVLQNDLGCVLEVIPVSVVKELAQELDWRLGSIDLLGWHVHVINEDD